MTTTHNSIRKYVAVRSHPTVVRLQDLETEDARWLSESFITTADLKRHLKILCRLLHSKTGSGIFLIGHYGSGKSHFLAYLTQQLHSKALLASPPEVIPLSLINFSATNRLEDIISDALDIEASSGDRRPTWDSMLAQYPQGLLLVIDELSEFLRAKPDQHAFTEDVRFLQYLGEWVQDRPCWIMGALQEGIEHTGELEYDLYRKIKDRYPLRLLLTPAHVKTLIADSILIKKNGYGAALDGLVRELNAAYPASAMDFDTLRLIYPLHPATLELLEEIRDRFSQARGVVDFAVTRLRGDETRDVPAFLDQPFGSLLTPDAILDHFRDLLELQPEFLPLAQQVLPWYQKRLSQMFDRPALVRLADRLLKLLILTHLSPARENLSAQQAAIWLVFNAARVEPERNHKIIERVLSTLVERGRYVSVRAGRYQLNLHDNAAEALKRLLNREVAALKTQGAVILETLIPLLQGSAFNPFLLPREQWQHRQVLWHFHKRHYAVWLGHTEPSPLKQGIGLCLRLPWGKTEIMAEGYTLQPAPIDITADLVELAALLRIRERPGNPELAQRIQQRLDKRGHLFYQVLRSSFQDATLTFPDGGSEPAPRVDAKTTLEAWLENIALRILRRRYPAFERYAPRHGSLPKEAWLRFMRSATHEDIAKAEVDDYVKLIREAYLVPMGLLRRRGREYQIPANLDRHELVRLIAPLLEHHPSPQTLHDYLAEPIYGLVPDQINLLLIFLLLQGEIDILKGRKSYRESYEILPNPLHYDRLSPGYALGMDNINALQRLCEGLQLRIPTQWTVLLQRRCATQLAELRRRHLDRLHPLLRQLKDLRQGTRLADRIEQYIDRWNALDKGEHQLQGLEQFLFEIGPVDDFVEEYQTYEVLPERITRLLGETQRYVQFFQHPALQRLLPENEAIDANAVPGLDDPQALETWLQRAAETYQGYKQRYRQGHDSWWQELAEHPIWDWQAPALASSQHLNLERELAELKRCQSEAATLRCRGLVNLDFQPQCSCGFDGENSLVGPVLERFEGLRERIETRMRLFFQQDEIKSRMRDWQREGLEMHTDTISYLEGRRPIPEIGDVQSLDRYLSGVELATEMDIAPIIELLCQRPWQPTDLLSRLEQRFKTQSHGRLRFKRSVHSSVPQQIIEWCVKQSLSFGIPLPDGFEPKELNTVTRQLCPGWVGPEALRRLEELGIDPSGIESILGWVLDGHIPLPKDLGQEDSLLGAVATMMHPPGIDTAQELAMLSERIYRVHDRLWHIVGKRWLDLLCDIADAPLTGLPSLPKILRQHRDEQWVLIDALGLPLLGPLQPIMFKSFTAWRQDAPQFAQVSTTTTTDACYRELLEAGITHPFEKINVIDELLHQGLQPFSDVIALAETQLNIACRRLSSRLDPKHPLLIFADHGFRIAKDGRSFGHGGPSTLERVVPVLRLVPK